MTTITAFSAGVSRIYRDKRHSGERRFISQKYPQLIERPTMQNPSLLTPSPDPVTNAVESFDSDSASGVFSVCNDLLGNAVVCVSDKGFLFAGNLLEMPFGRFRSALLEFCAEPGAATAHIGDMSTGVSLPVRRSRNDLYSEVHSDPFVYDCQRRIVHIANGNQVELALVKDEIRLAALHGNDIQFVGSCLVGEFAATVQRPNTDVLVFEVPKRHLGIRKRATPLKPKLHMLCERVGLSDLTDGPNYHLRPKSEPFTRLVIAEGMQGVLPERLFSPSLFADPVAAIVGSLQSFEQTSVAT